MTKRRQPIDCAAHQSGVGQVAAERAAAERAVATAGAAVDAPGESAAALSATGSATGSADAQPAAGAQDSKPVSEIGGRKGPEPTRYGDWEKNGRCIDF
mgnify:CR=1 FL=1